MKWSKGHYRDQADNLAALGAVSVLEQLTDPSHPNYIDADDLEAANV